jgi:branched-subunit amino acid ABC-type transport system permease component
VLWTSIASASFQVLFTVAFALVLKVTKIWNFTQPALMGIAFYAMYTGIAHWHWPPLASLGIALLATALVSFCVEQFAFETLRRRQSEPLAFFIFTLVFAEFAIFTLTLVFTTEPVFMLPNMMSPVRLVGDIVVSDWDMTAIVVTALLVVALWAWLRWTRWGQFLIAVADNAELAEVYGISKQQCYRLAMLIAAGFVSVAMYLFGTKLAFYPELALHVMTFAVAATILGGIGNIFGAAVSAVVISILQQMSVLFIDSRWQPLIVFGILFVAILFFPQGVRWSLRSRRARRDSEAATPAPRPAG